MILDMRTLFCALSVASAGLAGAVLLYAFTQRTFPGFRDWTKGIALVALGYIVMLLYDYIPQEFPVLVGNMGFILGCIYLLVGVRRFFDLPPQRYLLWLIGLPTVVVLAYLMWVVPAPVWRALVVALVVFWTGLKVALLLARHAPQSHLLLYLCTGLMLCLTGFGGLVRAVYLLITHPGHLLLAGNWVHAAYFLLVLFTQLFGVVGFLLINSQRLEEELNQSRSRLATMVKNQRRILDFLPDPTWVLDRQGRVTHWNLAMEGLTGVKATQILGKGEYEHALSLYGERRPCLIDLMMKSDPAWERRYANLERRGDMLATYEAFLPALGEDGRYVAGSATCLLDDQGRVSGAVEVMRDITEARRDQQEREKLIRDLTSALDKVQTLKGLIPICSHCKSIRRDEGYWEQLETFFSDHAEVEFSHGICPDCLEKYYQDWKKPSEPTGGQREGTTVLRKGENSDNVG
ncbi:MAG: PAS domain-containing protein [Deltaproteobacteria bacterium]|nr:PAS domain-containing protein [Deltaproteobacteria bacterium]